MDGAQSYHQDAILVSRLASLWSALRKLRLAIVPSSSGSEASPAMDETCHQTASFVDPERALLRHQIGARWDMIHRLNALKTPSSELSCALCGYTSDRVEFNERVAECIFEGGTIPRYQCPKCDVIFGSELMLDLSPEALAREYEWHYQVFTEGDSTEHEIRAFRGLNPERGKTYINWGSGAWSSSTELLRAEGWQVFGYEPHSSANGGGDYVLTSRSELEQLRPAGIFSNNVLEHFRYPVEALREMAALLPRGALMSHATPCFEYRFEFTRFHLFFFLGRSRAWIAENANLDIVDYQTDGDFMNLVLQTR